MPLWQGERITGRRGRYLMALTVAALAAGLRVVLALTVEPRPPMLVLSMGAVGVAAWFGGIGPGLLTTALCSVIEVFFVDPHFEFDVEHTSDLIDIGIFLIVGAGVAWVCESLHRARRDTERARRQAELASSREREVLKEAERRKDEFIALLAHELRNPLAPLSNAAAFLRRTSRPTVEEARCLDVIDRQTHQMARLLDDLLDVSRITRGKLTLHPQRLALSTALQHAIESAQPLIAAKGHSLEVSLPPQEVELDADPVRLLQIFSNVLTNAAKYTERGGLIQLRVEPHEREVEVVVKDSGIGIDAAHMPHIFEMFFQGNVAGGRSDGGLGLGLALTRGLVEMHGGSIRARSDGFGQGSEFTIRLPIDKAAPRRAHPPPRGPRRAQAARVLVADDNTDAAESLAMLLQLDGCEVRTVHDGEAAVRTAAEFHPTVVFLDLGMPRMDGYEACRRIRVAPGGRDMVLIALTGWGQDEDRRRCAEAGFDRHITKPADPQVVFDLLATAHHDASAGPRAPAPTS